MKACAILLAVLAGLAVWDAAGAQDLPEPLTGPADSLANQAVPEVWYDSVALTYPVGPGPGPRLAYPGFMARPVLERDFSAVIQDTWVKAGADRVFEARQRSFEDFSNIDIPIKFPQTIGRVIGQGANLNVTGSEQITFGGQTRYRVDEPLTEYGSRSKFPQLSMKQHLKIDLKGTVGEKINVMVHHDSDVETPLENRIKLRYEGDDDEIVQSVEMGNTNLSIPGSQFVGYSEQHQGLFGAKMLAKLGPLDLTAVASKQEGRTAGASYVGAAARDSVRLADLDYVKNKYFYMIDPYDLVSDATLTDVSVYLDDGNGNNDDADGAVAAYAFLDPNDLPPEAAWDSLAYSGKFNLLERNKDYAVDPSTGDLSLLRALDASHTLAVAYTYSGRTVGGSFVGGKLALKMMRPSQKYMIERDAVWGGTLKYMRKNVYSLGANYISEQKVTVRIYRKNPAGDVEYTQLSSSGEKYDYAKILGIDLEDEDNKQATAANNWATDRYADGGTINGDLGLVLFPDIRPFDPDIARMGNRPDTLKERNAKIYDVHSSLLRADEDSKYYIDVLFLTPQTTFRLKDVNILENSETVTLNGVRLTRGVDYDIYYDVGQIKFKTDEAASPDAKIVVDYQYVPYLSLAQQSLFGVQGTYKFWKNSYIGSAWIYQSKKSPEERPKLGQEPSQIMLGDLNTRLEFEPGWLTAFANALPLVKAEAASRLSLAGEVALSVPDPNTKGEVYIEDMEGVRDLRSFSLAREAWLPASPPLSYDPLDARRLWWYVKDNEVKEEDLFPEAESRPGEAYIPVLEINFRDLKHEEASLDPARQWGGLMRLVSKTGADYGDLRFLEVWLRQKQGDGGIMMVDLGAVSENFYHPGNDSLHTEDRDANGKMTDEENTGLDGVMDGHPGDDPYDNWAYTSGDYSQINGTERNPTLVADTEDLDGNGNLDQDEVFFRLGFDLEDTTYVINTSGDWRHYRIPLVDADTLGGSPNWKSIRYARFFFSEVDSPSVIQLAYLQISGASWLEEGIRKKEDMSKVDPLPLEAVEISAKNTRDDPDYDPPYDPGEDSQGYRKREQSLVFSARSLDAGHAGSIYKSVSSSNYTLYHTLGFYVHGDQNTASEDLYLFVRLGADSLNFYEYGTRVEPGWQDIRLSLDELTNLKSRDADSTVIYGKAVAVRQDSLESGWMAVYGNPSITLISRIGAGIFNAGSSPTSESAIEVWFDDLRLTDVRRETGVAKRVSVGASISDVISFTGDFKQSDTEFQSISGVRRGTDDTDLSLSAAAGVDRFLPHTGLTLPFTVTYQNTKSLPTLSSRSDVVLREDQRKAEEKTSTNINYSLGFSRKRASDNLLMRLTLDAISGRASYAVRRGNSPEAADTTSGYTGSLTYGFKPWWNHALRIYRNFSVSYMPESVNLAVTGNTSTSRQLDKRQNVVTVDKYTRDIKGDFTLNFKPISGGQTLETDYVFTMARDLDQNPDVPILSSIGRGTELRRNQKASVTLRPALGKLIRPTAGYNVNYDENADPSVRTASDPASARRISMSSRSSLDLLVQPSSYGARGGGQDTAGVSIVRRFLALVPDIDVGYFLDRSSKYNKVLGRPSLSYQLGLDRVVDEDIVLATGSTVGTASNDVTVTNGLDLSTELKPVEAVSLTTKYRRDKTERSYAGATTINKQTVWPDIAGNISSSVYLRLFRGAVKSSSITFGYKGTNSLSGELEKESTKGKKSEWLPLMGWDATWSNGVRTTLNVRHTNSNSEDIKGAGSERSSKTTAANFSIRHSFSAPEGMYIPLAGRTLKFTSNLSVELNVSYETREDVTNAKIGTSTRTILVTPKASYSFSKNATGSADARFEQTTDRLAKTTYRTIGLNVSVLIRF